METPATSASSSGPVLGAERIASLDVLRGVAVLGILVINIQVFSMIGAAFRHPHAYGPLEGVEYAAWLVPHVLCGGRFMTIFAMLFGAGIVLMAERRRATGLGSAGLHYRRMGVLIVIGMLHAYLFWYGDILYAYAMAGLIAYLLHKLRPSILIGIGVVLFVFASWMAIREGLALAALPEDELRPIAAGWTPTEEMIEHENARHRVGWFGQLGYRAQVSFYIQWFLFPIRGMWLTLAVICFGMATYKLGILSAARSRAFYTGMIAVALLVGVPLSLLGVYLNHRAEWAFEFSRFQGTQFNIFAALPVAGGWIGAVMLLCGTERGRRLLAPLAAVGRMALTNYLMQTVICTLIFYGHGFGLYGRLDRVEQLGVVLAIWVLQLVVSPWWMKRFRFGPAEWFWRSASYLKLQGVRPASSARG